MQLMNKLFIIFGLWIYFTFAFSLMYYFVKKELTENYLIISVVLSIMIICFITGFWL